VTTLGATLLVLSAAPFMYAYLGYPVVLWLLSRVRNLPLPHEEPSEWPEITILLPVHNEEQAVAGALDGLLALEYPAARRHVVAISDASTDGTDRILTGYSARGVQTVRVLERSGKHGAENVATSQLRGTIVVCTDATTRIPPHSLKFLIGAFQDPSIGLASGRDISVDRATLQASTGRESPQGESGYVGYEMWIRSLESRIGSIVGASGCFYAIRRELFESGFPPELSRDFASALTTVERGYRAVSVSTAICLVPRAGSLRAELRRKVRTMARGLATIWSYRRLMALGDRPLFSLCLISHKLIRWLAFLTAPAGLVGLGLLALEWRGARWLLMAALGGLALGVLSYVWPSERRLPRVLEVSGYVTGSLAAGLIAWTKALRGEMTPIWEPTRRQ
jgi:cellulose synthase/poly-beta-1,6-N-acetylglucosamine synthase-like glycosyltransferase